MHRRQFLASSLAVAVAAALGRDAAADSPSPEVARARALYDELFEQLLQATPQRATTLGLDVGGRAALRSRLDDRSDFETVAWLVGISGELGSQPIGTVDSCNCPVPYVLGQLTGAYQSTPGFLDTRHPVESATDAEACLARLEAYYPLCLRYQTSTRMTPDEAHALGLAQVAEIEAAAEPLLEAQGLASRTVGARLTALGQDPRWLYPNTAACRHRSSSARRVATRSRAAWTAAGRAPVTSISPTRESGPAGRCRRSPTTREPAGSSPAGLAGPRGAGHAVAAPDAADERVRGRLGAVRRAARRRVRHVPRRSPRPPRHAPVVPVPGRAHRGGHGAALARLGPRFDLRGFHDIVLAGGAMPLEVLEQVVNDWIRRMLK